MKAINLWVVIYEIDKVYIWQLPFWTYDSEGLIPDETISWHVESALFSNNKCGFELNEFFSFLLQMIQDCNTF